MKPGPVLFTVIFVWFLLGTVSFFWDFFSLVWIIFAVISLPLIIIDALLLFFLVDRLSVTRELPSSLAQGESTWVKLTIARENNTGSLKKLLPAKIAIWDLYPSSMETDAFPAILDKKQLKFINIEPCIFEYKLTPKERGLWWFNETELLLSSFCRLWLLKREHRSSNFVRTYPNFNKMKAAAQMDLKGILEKSGLKNIRMRGHGLEFSSLRDYKEGDSIKAIDWRATSRRQKVIIKEYQEERDQQLLFLLDTGYRLHSWDTDHNNEKCLQFDNALEASLLLSWISLKHGDSVGMGSFGSESSNTQNRWLSPRKGLSTFPLLMNNFYDLQSSPSPSSPFSALEEALTKLKRRTFIILISNLREEDNESLSLILKHITKRHLLLFVSLREKESELIAYREPKGTEEALETAAAFSYMISRRDLYRSWEHSGILTMECSGSNLSSALINRYLDIKRSGRL